jgi:trimeric autotransporter adhesin
MIMKNLSSKIVLAMSLCLAACTGLFAQPINMGANPINFGTGCNSSFIRNNTATAKIGFGINEFCIGGGLSSESIVMDVFNNRLGIGVLSPSYQLQLATNSAAKPGSSTWTVVSDKRLKQDINTFADGLSTVRGIKPVTFHYNASSGYDSKPQYVGVLAQDLQQVAPYMVQSTEVTDEAGKQRDYLAVDFGAMDFVLVNAVKELDAELQYQKTENELWRAALADLRSLVSGQATTSTFAPCITVAPNPANADVKISCTLPKGSQSASIQVIGIDGNIYSNLAIDTNLLTPHTMATHDLPAATYILKLVADGKMVATARLVVAH